MDGMLWVLNRRLGWSLLVRGYPSRSTRYHEVFLANAGVRRCLQADNSRYSQADGDGVRVEEEQEVGVKEGPLTYMTLGAQPIIFVSHRHDQTQFPSFTAAPLPLPHSNWPRRCRSRDGALFPPTGRSDYDEAE